MIYHISLGLVALVVGLLHGLGGVLAIFFPAGTQGFLQRFPRNRMLGRLLLGAGTVWAASLCATIDLGEYSWLRSGLVFVSLALGALAIWLLEDFPSVRGLSILLLLGANVLLDAAFLSDRSGKIAVVLLAYLWVFAGILFVSLPHLFRDRVCEPLARPAPLRAAAWGALAIGAGFVAFGLGLG
ncbi:hypothetical protein MAMC_00112 [Methylacidimicrobium cyclopophantes]|uniref:Uncharacterized protein n=1 Tax=Methylacidimicrobium cyclopophantes TaxID=1041766 RepID=A0A5E6M5D5_9BACT|nr:hypothetical protein [Methylacidimicrobium cyclopophantes]VVM04549.1 hypothetical protein MAMC_00112 [Methylacidimicrobium cyclopophantes]